MITLITLPRTELQAALDALAVADNIALVGAAYTPKSIDLGVRKIRSAATNLRKALAAPQPAQPAKPLTDDAQHDRGYLHGLQAGYSLGQMSDEKGFAAAQEAYQTQLIEAAHSIKEQP